MAESRIPLEPSVSIEFRPLTKLLDSQDTGPLTESLELQEIRPLIDREKPEEPTPPQLEIKHQHDDEEKTDENLTQALDNAKSDNIDEKVDERPLESQETRPLTEPLDSQDTGPLTDREELEEPRPSQLEHDDSEDDEDEEDEERKRILREVEEKEEAEEEKKKETERKLNNALAEATKADFVNKDDNWYKRIREGRSTEDKFNYIKSNVTPKILSSCKTNAFFKAFEVNQKLKCIADKGGPEAERFNKLAGEVEDFSAKLANQLYSGLVSFNEKWWDYVVDEAIHRQQKKFISQPAIDNILQRRWYGKYVQKTKGWRFHLLLLWVLIESIFFPFILPIFGTIHLMSRRTDSYMERFRTPFFIFARDTLSYFGLVDLHFMICLSPSTVAFSVLEWIVLVFFLARLMMEVDQFIAAEQAEKKRIEDMSDWVQSDRAVRSKLSNYFRDQWNVLDLIIIIIYIVTFNLRMITWGVSVSVVNNRLLAVAFDLYGFIAMLLTLRAFGHVMEGMRGTGAIQIALVYILRDVVTIFWQFVAMVLAFSFVISRIYASERSYAPTANKTEELTCNRAGLYCWWSIAKHLVWSVLGIADWDTLSSEDSVSESLVHSLYGLFLIMGVILLVNMMIALLSNTYQSVQENSLREWSFKKALTIQTYGFYHPVPVPFNLLSIPAMALYKRCKTKSGREIIDTGWVPVEDTMQSVTMRYFNTYGDSFPLTGDGKIDRIAHQISGNREMVNEIARQVFRQRGNRELKFRTGECAWKSPGIEIEGNMLTYQGSDFCEECKMSGMRNPCHGARYLSPFTKEMPRMEVLIQEFGELWVVGVGAVFEDYDHHFMPGWDDGTVGYHSDDGKIFENSGSAKEGEDALAYRGDLMACEVDFENASNENRTIPVKFFLNCREVGQSAMSYTSEREDVRPFPYIGLESKGTRVLVKMCAGKAKRDHLNELADAEEPSHTDMLEEQMGSIEKQMGFMEKQMGSVEKQMGFIQEQLEERRKEMKVMEEERRKEMEDRRKEMKNMEEDRRKEMKVMEENMRKEMKIMEEDRRKETKLVEEDRRKETEELRELLLQLVDQKKN